MPSRASIEDRPAAQRVGRREAPYDDPVAIGREHRLLQPQLPQPVPEISEPAGRVAGAMVDLNALAMTDAVGQRQRAIQDRGLRHTTGGREHIAA